MIFFLYTLVTCSILKLYSQLSYNHFLGTVVLNVKR
jgi:hypothetical protein